MPVSSLSNLSRHAAYGLSVVAVVVGMASPVHAAVPAFALDWLGNLKTIDLVGPTVILDGPTGIGGATLQGLAISASNQLYATDTSGVLYALSPTGVPTFIANTGIGPTYGLDFYSPTTMIAADDMPQQTIYEITTAGVASPLVTLANPVSRIDSIATVNPNTAYILTDGGFGTTDLSEVSLVTGMVLPILTLPEVCKGLDYALDGNWYAIGYVGKTFRVNPVLGTYQQVVYTGGEDWQALAAPVPEPASLAGLALCSLLLRRRG
jgi:hypothetical protein